MRAMVNIMDRFMACVTQTIPVTWDARWPTSFNDSACDWSAGIAFRNLTRGGNYPRKDVIVRLLPNQATIVADQESKLMPHLSRTDGGIRCHFDAMFSRGHHFVFSCLNHTRIPTHMDHGGGVQSILNDGTPIIILFLNRNRPSQAYRPPCCPSPSEISATAMLM